MPKAPVAAFAIALLAASLPATAAPSTQLADSWPQLAYASDGACELEIAGNGKFMQIRAAGLGPGEALRFGLTNAAMKPIDRQVRADPVGRWQQIYIPFLWNGAYGPGEDRQSGGIVAVTLESIQCRVTATAPWQRAIRVIP